MAFACSSSSSSPLWPASSFSVCFLLTHSRCIADTDGTCARAWPSCQAAHDDHHQRMRRWNGRWGGGGEGSVAGGGGGGGARGFAIDPFKI